MPPKARTTGNRRKSTPEAAPLTARGMKVTPLNAEGEPTGPSVDVGAGPVTITAEPSDQAALDAPMPGTSVEFEITDPQEVAALRELFRVPIPTAVIAEWFPAYFRADPAEQPWPTCKVFLTPQGLYVYRAMPEESETFTTGATPAWYSTVDFAKTAKPVTGYAALNAGIPIMTAAGKVNVQPSGGCGCGHRRLKNWTPSWARNRISWADAVALTDTTAGR